MLSTYNPILVFLIYFYHSNKKQSRQPKILITQELGKKLK